MLKERWPQICAKDVCSAVHQLTGRTTDEGSIDGVGVGVGAKTLNAHHASVSTDPSYSVPIAKSKVTPIEQQQYVSEWQVFQVLDHTHSTATR